MSPSPRRPPQDVHTHKHTRVFKCSRTPTYKHARAFRRARTEAAQERLPDESAGPCLVQNVWEQLRPAGLCTRSPAAKVTSRAAGDALRVPESTSWTLCLHQASSSKTPLPSPLPFHSCASRGSANVQMDTRLGRWGLLVLQSEHLQGWAQVPALASSFALLCSRQTRMRPHPEHFLG